MLTRCQCARLHFLVFTFLAVILSPPPLFSGQAAPAPTWKEKWEQVVASARKEGKVVVMGPVGDQIRQALTQEFPRRFPGIDIEYVGGRGGELATKIKAEWDANIYSFDVVLSGTTTAGIYLKPMGVLRPVEPLLILPEVKNGQYWRDNILEFSDPGTRYNLVFATQPLPPLLYNPQQVREEEVDEFSDLLDPKWKGKIVINDPVPSGAGAAVFRFFWKVLGPEKARDYYRKIRAQAAIVTRDQRGQIEWIAQGKYPVLMGPSITVFAPLLQRGLKFGILPAFKDYGTLTTASSGSLMVLDKAPHPNAAAVFANWLLTREGQIVVSKALDYVSRRLDVPTDQIPSWQLLKPGVSYWKSYMEDDVNRSDEEEKIIKELFGK